MLEDLYIHKVQCATSLARQHRLQTMAGNITPIYRCDETLPIRENCAKSRAYPAKTCWEKNHGSVAHRYLIQYN
jgi:hypothetical protein